MAAKLVVGLEGEVKGDAAVDHARNLAKLIGDCEVLLVYVIEWSPFSFQTPEENAMRHKRREEEIQHAHERVVDPAVAALKADGLSARGIVRHGDVAEQLESVADTEGAAQIVVARSSKGGLRKRLMGSTASNLAMSADIPVTVVGGAA